MSPSSNRVRHRDHRPVYCGPGRNVLGPDDIGMCPEPAQNALELALRLPVLLVDVATREASPGGVPGIDDGDLHSSLQRLVRDELAHLTKGPPHVHRTLTLPNGYPLTDAMEVFHGEAARGALSLANECLADAVVLDLTEAGLLARDLLEVTLGRLGVGALEPVAEAGVSLPDRLGLGAGVMFAIAVGGEITDPEVDAQPLLGVHGSALGHLDGDVEVELALAGNEVGLSTGALHLAPVVGADDGGDDDALVERGEGHPVQSGLEGVEALVVGDGAIGSERGELGLVALVGFADLGDAANGKLGVEAEGGADLVVVELLELELIGRLDLERLGGEPVAGAVEAGHEVHEGGLLRRVNDELAGGHELHVHRTKMTMGDCQGRFLPDLKDGASAACSSAERIHR